MKDLLKKNQNEGQNQFLMCSEGFASLHACLRNEQ